MPGTKEQQNGITEGVIWKQILLFFFPILIGTFFQQLYNTVDAIVVGQFAGKEALSSVGGSSAQIINFVVGFFTGLTSGCSVIISQYYGAKEEEGLHRALHTAYAFSLIGGIVLGIAGVFFAPEVLRLMNTPDELMATSLLYIRIYFAGLVFVFIYNMGSAVLRAIGDSKRPLYYLIACCLINIVLDLLLVWGFGLGVLGVAVATLTSQAVSAVLVTCTLMGHTPGMELRLREIRIYRGTLGMMLRIGLPSGIQSSMYSFSNILIQSSMNHFGVDTMAAWTAYGKIDCIFWMINGAFGIAISTFVGQNYGAGKWERIRKGVRVCLLMDLMVAIAISGIVMIFGAPLLGIFTPDADVIAIGTRFMEIISPTYFLFVFIEMFSGALRAEGHVAIPTAISICCICMFRMVWISWIVPNGTLEQIVWCYPLSWLFSAELMTVYYLYKQRRVLQRTANN